MKHLSHGQFGTGAEVSVPRWSCQRCPPGLNTVSDNVFQCAVYSVTVAVHQSIIILLDWQSDYQFQAILLSNRQSESNVQTMLIQ